MADLNRGKRPLSPFMIGPYYRPQMTSISSILTRITGNALIVTFALIVWWLVAAATGPHYYIFVSHVLTSWFGKLVLLLSILGVWYHFLAGLRHLWFDSGRGLEIETAEKLGWVVIIGSVVLTVLTVVIL